MPASIRLAPEPADRLADGVLVEAQVRARLLGAPILRLDAEVLLTQARADVVAGPVVDDGVADGADGADGADAAGGPPRAVAAGRRGDGVPAPGSDLARAAALVQSSARSLHELDRRTHRR